MPYDLDYGIVLSVNPHFSVEKVLVASCRSCPHDEAVVRAEILLAKQGKGVVCGADAAVSMALTRRCFHFAIHQAVEHKMAHHWRSLFRDGDEGFCVRRAIVQPHYFLCVHLPLRVDHRLATPGGIRSP